MFKINTQQVNKTILKGYETTLISPIAKSEQKLYKLIQRKLKSSKGCMPLADFIPWLSSLGYAYKHCINSQDKLGFAVGCDYVVRLIK